MQTTDPYGSGLSVSGVETLQRLGQRFGELKGEVDRKGVAAIRAILADEERAFESKRDAVSTLLMAAFRETRGRGCFGLLYELNGQHLLLQVHARLRRYASKADPRDVLQEVFFNIYRYPHRFNPAREDAFRVWTAMIVRNTVLKHLRSLSRGGRSELNFEDVPEQPAEGVQSPLGHAVENESRDQCARVYLTYLQLYLEFYSMLSERERLALHLVEVEEKSYREAAARLGIKLENLKMVIFRARRKIHRSMRRVFDGLSPDCRPARDPRRDAGAGRGERKGTETSARRAGTVAERLHDRDASEEGA